MTKVFKVKYRKTINERIFEVLSDGKPRTLFEIIEAIGGGSQTGCSARVRDLRKPMYGGHQIDGFWDGPDYYYQYIKPKARKQMKGK